MRSWIRSIRTSRTLAALAERLDAEEVRADVDVLHRVAPLEAWWLTAQLGKALGVGQWQELAASRRVALAR